MPHRAMLIRASNSNPPPTTVTRHRLETRPRSIQQRRGLVGVPPAGYVNYGVRENDFVLASITDGIFVGEPGRLDMQTLVMLGKVESRPRKGRPRLDGVCSTYFDKDSPNFEWLHRGWLAEKVVPRNSLPYWCYYDPQGKQYRTKKQVLQIFN